MSVIAEAVRHLLAAGVTGDALVTAIADMESAQKPARSSAAIRQARYRQNKRNVLRNVDNSDALSPPLKEPPHTPQENIPPNSLSSLRSERETRDRASFDRFWLVWPNKVGKPAAEKAFKRVSGEVDEILLGVDRYIRTKPPDRPWLNPATFLNQRRWEDVPAEEAAAEKPERDLRNVPDYMLSSDDYWKKRRQISKANPQTAPSRETGKASNVVQNLRNPARENGASGLRGPDPPSDRGKAEMALSASQRRQEGRETFKPISSLVGCGVGKGA